jgi:hypothetical protein
MGDDLGASDAIELVAHSSIRHCLPVSAPVLRGTEIVDECKATCAQVVGQGLGVKPERPRLAASA